MNNFSELEKQLRGSPNAERLMKAADCAEGRRLAQSLDQAAVERAAKSGDSAALQSILAQVMSTPDGRALAQKIQKVMQGK